MRVLVNGEGQEVEEGCTLAALLARLRQGSGACAVELNRELVPRRELESRSLSEGDSVEVVTLVGGG